MNSKIAKYQKNIIDTAKKLDITYLALFGSYARGEEKDGSDIDILVDFDVAKRKSLFDVMQAEEELTLLLGKKVDLVTRAGLSKHIKPYIVNDLQLIYG